MSLADQADHPLGVGEARGWAAERHGGRTPGGVHHPNQDAEARLQSADRGAPPANNVPEGASRDLEGRLTRRAEARRREPVERRTPLRGDPEERGTSR